MTRPHNSREGIALIVVVGFLSVLLILAVAFAVSMRTERLATRGYVDYMKSRHLTWVALARAMEEIETTTVLYPSVDVVGSGGSGGCTNILEGSAGDYVPDSLLSNAADRASLAWQPIVYDSKTLGRYAYLVVNCSGLLDASSIGGLTRTYGTNIHEIQVGPGILPEMHLTTYDNLWSARNQYWVRYESLPELNRLGIITNPPVAFLADYPASLFHYSYFLTTQYVDVAGSLTSSLCIRGSEADLSAIQARIQDQFDQIVDIPDAAAITLALLDYVDPNNIPRSTAGICTEPVPMVNEIVVGNRISADVVGTETVYTNFYQVWVEVWYPFHGVTNDAGYQLQVGAVYSGMTPPAFKPGNLSQTIPLAGPWTAGEYRVVGTPWAFSAAVTNPPNMLNLANAQVQVAVRLSQLSAPGGIVDELAAPGMVITNVFPTGTPMPGNYTAGMAANDPRLNWNSFDTNQWKPVTVGGSPPTTLGLFNAGVATPAAADCDGLAATNMYIRNGPLQTVGELGFLLYDRDRPWRTIRLLGPGALPVLDRFTLTTNHSRMGLVNPNTRDTNVLRAVLVQVPADRWPGEGATNISVEEAGTIAQALVDAPDFENLSSISNVTEASFPAALDSLQKEGVVRNTAGLLSPRQNLFTILLAVQALDSSGSVAAEQRAVALVWRDPYPPNATSHPAFIRFFKWLTDTE